MRETATRVLLVSAGVLVGAPPVLACPVCFGQSDSPLASGVNWGILFLLVVTGGVLTAFASFFITIFKRSRATMGEPLDVPRSVRQEGNY